MRVDRMRVDGRGIGVGGIGGARRLDRFRRGRRVDVLGPFRLRAVAHTELPMESMIVP